MNKRIVIIGGMGPQASIELHSRIIENAARHGAKDGGDFPEIVHVSMPIDDFISDENKLTGALAQMKKSLSCLYLWRPRYSDYRL